MALTKIKLGKYIELFSQKCNIPNLTNDQVSGVNKEKELFEPSNQVGGDTSKYKIVPPNYFACNLMHVGRDVVLPIAYNHSGKNKIVSPAYFVFKFIENDELLSDYFFIFLKSVERDRYFWFHTDGSVRDGMSWEDFIDVEIELPPMDIQSKYVEIYKGMLDNQIAYETGLEDLKLVCDGYIEDLKRKYTLERLECYLERTNIKNSDNKIKNVKNVSVYKTFNEPTAKVNKNELSGYKIVKPNEISFVQTTHNEKVFAFAINNTEDDIVVTSVNEVFKTTDKLDPYYLSLFFMRKEFDRYARFHSWGSARETFVWEDLCDVKIPIPPMNIQKSIADIFKVFQERKKINEQLKQQIKNICPVLIKGAVEEAKRS